MPKPFKMALAKNERTNFLAQKAHIAIHFFTIHAFN